MSIYTTHSMTNHHVPSLLSEVVETLHVWHERYRTRKELSQLSARDIRDVGLSWTDVAWEANKPFWRA
jgi:uncharacterized protein YjiS (DUF1127 family)